MVVLVGGFNFPQLLTAQVKETQIHVPEKMLTSLAVKQMKWK